MTDVTRILSAVEQGDPHAAAQLLPLVYDELRRLAAQRLVREKPGQTLEAKVALKILKPGMDTDQVVARFEAERQAW